MFGAPAGKHWLNAGNTVPWQPGLLITHNHWDTIHEFLNYRFHHSHLGANSIEALLSDMLSQHFRSVSDYAHATLTTTRILICGTPDYPWSTSLFLWALRIVTFSLLLRTYLVPWLLGLMTQHIRIRSISLRSIRGLYFHRGNHTLRVDRISWWSKGKAGSSRFALKVDNLTLVVGNEGPKPILVDRQRKGRRLWQDVLDPSPMIGQLRRLMGAMLSYIDPIIRPILRKNAVTLLRFGIRWFPTLIQAMSFELQNIVVTFAGLPGAKITIEEVTLIASCELIGLEDVVLEATSIEKKSNAMSAWTNRVADGFKRSLDRAWGAASGKGKVEFKVYNIYGGMPLNVGGPSVSFLSLPDIINMVASMEFKPRAGTIDTHTLELGLALGSCSAKVDLMNLLLDKLKPSAPPPSLPRERPTSQSIGVDSPLYSSFGLPSAGFSASIQSALPSFASSLFSPVLKSGPMSALSPTAGKMLSPASLASPTSPFFRALSASIRPRQRTPLRPVSRLKEASRISTLSVLRKVEISVDSITLSASRRSPLSSYRGVVKKFHVSATLAHLSQSPHRQHWNGKAPSPEIYDPDTYTLTVTIKKMQLERGTRLDSLPLVTIGEQNLHILAHQWPAPFLVVSPFMSGDPNAPFIGVAFKMEGIEATQRLDHLQELLNSIDKLKAAPSATSTQTPPAPRPLGLARFSVSAEIGPICTTLIFTSNSGQDLRALELKTSGMLLKAHSEYHHASPSILSKYPTSSSVVPVRLHSDISIFLEPITVLTRSMTESDDSNSLLEDPSVLSMGSFEFTAQIHGVAETDGPGEGIAVVNRESIMCNCSSVIEAICIELWNPNVVDSVHQLLSVMPVKHDVPPVISPEEVKNSRFSQLPIGLSGRGFLGQFVVFVTAPDINPNDTLDLSRGVSIRFAGVLECRSLRQSHLHWLEGKVNRDHRTRLKLFNDSLDAEKGHNSFQHDSSTFIRLRLSHTILRSLVATPFELSEPLLTERLDVPQLPQDVLKVKQIQIDLSIASSPPALNGTQAEDIINMNVDIPSIRGDFKLAHIYSALLAVQTVESLQPPRSSPKPKAPIRSRFSFTLQLKIATVQLFWTLPKRNIVTRIDSFKTSMSSKGPPSIGFEHAIVFVPLPSRVNRWESSMQGRWDELLNLRKWEVFLSPLDDTVSISVQGESGRLKIPSGFVFHDLVLDTVIMIKALRHISHITKAGRFWKMPAPEPEGPKSIPLINVRIHSLCLEAQDDPFECKLGLIWQAGFEAAKQRMEREEAFVAKVAAIMLAEQQSGNLPRVGTEYQFDSRHSVPIDDARQRLDKVHVLDWTLRLQKLSGIRLSEGEAVLHELFGPDPLHHGSREPNIVPVVPPSGQDPPLVRFSLHDLNMSVSPPSFPLPQLPTYLHNQGGGMPKNTQFSLLVPFHLHFSLSAARCTLRDYPIPLLDILPHDDGKSPVWTFDTDLVIAEEMGTERSVEWLECAVIDQNDALHGEAMWSLLIPKTIMPVKTYANASIQISSPYPTVLAWGISYGPAIQDLMRIVETLTSPPQDPSPAMGFWDKMRLSMHWTLDIKFSGDVQAFLKGGRDPYETFGVGAGFVLGWQGNPHLRIGFENEQKEAIQFTSDLMFFAVPDLDYVAPNSFAPHAARTMGIPKPFKKVWARLNSGVRFGVGFLPERTCGPECTKCSGSPSHRQCRLFTFKPHYAVKMERKPFIPEIKSIDDSYNEFRSDFVHLSFSLESSLKKSVTRSSIERDYSSLHLTPKLFAHFWAWCSLFDGALILPVRQGIYYPAKPVSPKLGRHIATLKYRISIPHLYVMHGYIDGSRETWVDGVTTWVGAKGMVDEFHVDLHQREEETTVPGPVPGTTRILRRKPLYAAEVVLKGLDLRALLATFPNPMKKDVPVAAPPQRSNYRKHSGLPTTSPTSPWHEPNDFVELDWRSSSIPTLNLLPAATIPRFAYFKRISSTHNRGLTNKFGSENSHICLLDKEPSISKVQILLASARAAELRSLVKKATQRNRGNVQFDQGTAEKMITLLEDYVTVLQNLESGKEPGASDPHTYFLPSEIVSSAELAEFENVYQIHCPSIFLDGPMRDIMMQYYYCSRARRGLEYHMAARAVKFVRDQANATIDVDGSKEKNDSMAELATATLRKILKTDSPKPSFEMRRDKAERTTGKIDPLNGWADGVSLSKSHCCLLLKPQIVLRGSELKDTCIVTAGQAKLQAFAIMDILNMDDPISGKVMSRNYMSLSGLQVYSPTHPLALGNSSIPLEVLIDLRCESTQFERLVPQTDAIFHYDKFNRLRLRNKNTTAAARVCTSESQSGDTHLQNQTDLVRVHIPRFTVAANAQHFQAISNVVTKLLLFSDPVHKTRVDRLETLIFTYDFRDLNTAANVIASLQSRVRDAIETEQLSARDPKRIGTDADKLSFLKLKAHIFLLEEELSFLFDAIKLAQDRFDASSEQNSALLLHASSSEISWKMLDERTNLLSKLVVKDIDFNWLNRQDSSTVNHLTVGNLTAFDGSRHAMWAEIISKHDEPSNHPLLKKRLFCLANWTILAPVGGITIYETFELAFHPLRLQIDAKVGKKIMEYVWPDRKDREESPSTPQVKSPVRSSIDSPRGLSGRTAQTEASLAAPRKLASRSFTDLRATTESFLAAPTFLHRNRSNDSLNPDRNKVALIDGAGTESALTEHTDATVMKNRSSQKSFVFVRIASLSMILSISKEGSFECRDARIKTRDLEYRNQTWSFEELVHQFIPSNMSWRGWLKMAFHQPLLPVLPVAKELISKTRWTSSKNTTQLHESPFKLLHPRMLTVTDDDSRLEWLQSEGSKLHVTPPQDGKKPSKHTKETPTFLTSKPLSSEPESIAGHNDSPQSTSSKRATGRSRVKSLFSRNKGSSKGGDPTEDWGRD